MDKSKLVEALENTVAVLETVMAYYGVLMSTPDREGPARPPRPARRCGPRRPRRPHWSLTSGF